MTPGKKPASNTPSRKRSTYSWLAVVTNMVIAEVMPHSTMMRVSVLRAPILSSSRLLGISNRA
ncbi:hypothetical protein D3C75_817930 [compost metagenome]